MRWLIDTYQPAAHALHIKGAEACGHGAPLLGCHTEEEIQRAGRTRTHAHAHAQDPSYITETIRVKRVLTVSTS